MATNKQKEKLTDWLDDLQQESWQLELLISGFVVFLLIGGWDPVKELGYDLTLLKDASSQYLTLNFLYHVFRTAYFTLLVCLLIHVTMRGLWIAAVGLRSVSGDIDYDSLPYQARFTERLRRRTGSFDRYIERLERNCSVVFSLAFLILFCFLSLATWSVFSVILQWLYLWCFGYSWQGTGILGGAGIVSLVVVIVGFIYFFDFVTLGLLKRNKWLSKPYYYLYIFMGWVTLARFYRPLYYNLIDHRFGKRLAMLLPVAILMILVAVSLRQVSYAYFPILINDGKVWLDHNNYDDENPVPDQQYWRLSLASRYPTNNYIEAFAPYRPVRDDKVIEFMYPGLTVSQYVGTKVHGAFTVGERFNQDADYPAILTAMGELSRLYLNDSLLTDLKPLFFYHKQRQQPGLSYMIPVHELPPGRHELMVKARFLENDSLGWSSGRTIYFYK